MCCHPTAPRIAFPNPTGDDYTRTSYGCLKGPFVTGLNNTATGLDQGAGFSLSEVRLVAPDIVTYDIR